ncbi:MAG: LamG domain-containing protein, partial [Patescibacteria group bacterium]|nr:LamG domain-containing protein [Patescibacteria group bacterium]
MRFNHESPLFLLALIAFSGMAASFVISSTPLSQLQQAPNSQLAQVSCATGDLTCGLVGWWKLNDGSGTTAADSSGSGNNGTLSGSTLPTWTAGEIGGALQFNSAGFVNVGHSSSLDLTSGFTLAFWIKYDSSSGYILAKRSGATNSYSVLVSSSGAVYVVNAKGSTVSTGMTLPPGVWTHVALVVDDTGLDFTPYLNGIAGSTRSLVTAYPSAASQDLLLGASGSGSNGSN